MNSTALIQRMKPILHALLARLTQEQSTTADNARTVTLDQSSVGRMSGMDAMQQQAMAQASMQRLQLQRRRREAALQRVQQLTYGICCDCAEPIGLELLLSDPAAPFCMDCPTERDAERDAAR